MMKFALLLVACVLLLSSMVSADHATSPVAPSSELFEGFIPYGTFGAPLAPGVSSAPGQSFGTFKAATLEVESLYEVPISQLTPQTIKFDGFSFSSDAAQVTASAAVCAAALLAFF